MYKKSWNYHNNSALGQYICAIWLNTLINTVWNKISLQKHCGLQFKRDGYTKKPHHTQKPFSSDKYQLQYVENKEDSEYPGKVWSPHQQCIKSLFAVHLENIERLMFTFLGKILLRHKPKFCAALAGIDNSFPMKM